MQLNQRFNFPSPSRYSRNQRIGEKMWCFQLALNQNSEFNLLYPKLYVQHYLLWWFNQILKRATFVTHKTDLSHFSCATKLPPASSAQQQWSNWGRFISLCGWHTSYLQLYSAAQAEEMFFLDSIKGAKLFSVQLHSVAFLLLELLQPYIPTSHYLENVLHHSNLHGSPLTRET